MSQRNHNLKVSTAFPAKAGESWTVRDGRGQAAERWTVLTREEHKTVSILRMSVTDYGLIQ